MTKAPLDCVRRVRQSRWYRAPKFALSLLLYAALAAAIAARLF